MMLNNCIIRERSIKTLIVSSTLLYMTKHVAHYSFPNAYSCAKIVHVDMHNFNLNAMYYFFCHSLCALFV